MNLLLTVIVIIAALLVLRATRNWGRGTRQAMHRPPPGQATDADVERFVSAGRKITAIKLYREIHDVDLKTAKEAVDELARKLELHR
jgi:ribosomal protein L7/L12